MDTKVRAGQEEVSDGYEGKSGQGKAGFVFTKAMDDEVRKNYVKKPIAASAFWAVAHPAC
ncbi:hypothetical protein [Paenibacillus thalictri]|uniref:Uncharacterized protein n=1 Tax=Paenibacillus thalictri TaxID=2527873 RepID=A0A4Q9E190_9BACL|nr:hypothetical protein [Paenibacillus thalictri]TBL81933.1 hypothetical protein EYB31_00010 [Paenibacillus thalictri]